MRPVPETIVGRIIGISISSGICDLIVGWHPLKSYDDSGGGGVWKKIRFLPINMAADSKGRSRKKGRRGGEKRGFKRERERWKIKEKEDLAFVASLSYPIHTLLFR